MRIIGNNPADTNGRVGEDSIIPEVLESTIQNSNNNFSEEQQTIGSSGVVTEIISNIKDQNESGARPQQVEAFQKLAAAVGGDLSSLYSTDKPDTNKSQLEFISGTENADSLKVGVSEIKAGIARTARINQESRLEVDSSDQQKTGVSSIVDPVVKHIEGNQPESHDNGESIEAFQKFAAAIGGDLHESVDDSHVEVDQTKALRKFVAAFGGDPTAIEDFINEQRKEEKPQNSGTPNEKTHEVGLAGITNTLARTARINQESRSDVEGQASSKTGVSGIIEPIFEHLEKQKKTEDEHAGVGLISDSIVQRLEAAHGNGENVKNEDQNEEHQRVLAKGIIKEVLHAIKGYHTEKPHKPREVEQFGDKIRVSVNRVKERNALKTTYVDQDIPANFHS